MSFWMVFGWWRSPVKGGPCSSGIPAPDKQAGRDVDDLGDGKQRHAKADQGCFEQRLAGRLVELQGDVCSDRRALLQQVRGDVRKTADQVGDGNGFADGTAEAEHDRGDNG